MRSVKAALDELRKYTLPEDKVTVKKKRKWRLRNRMLFYFLVFIRAIVCKRKKRE